MAKGFREQVDRPVTDVMRPIDRTIDFDEPVMAAVYEMTEGNPFFIYETVRLLSAEGRLDGTQRETSWSLTLPQGIRDVIGRRLNTLSEECDRVLRLAAVIGRDFAVHVLERLSEISRERLLGLLEEAVAARIVTDEAERRAVLEVALVTWRREHQVEAFVDGAPLIEVVFDDDSLLPA